MAGHGIQRAKGFIHQQDFRAVRQRTGDGDTLFHATGKLRGPGISKLRQLHQFEMLTGFFTAFRAAESGGFQRKLNVLTRCQPGQQGVRLKYHATVKARAANGFAIHLNVTAVVILKPGCNRQ